MDGTGGGEEEEEGEEGRVGEVSREEKSRDREEVREVDGAVREVEGAERRKEDVGEVGRVVEEMVVDAVGREGGLESRFRVRSCSATFSIRSSSREEGRGEEVRVWEE